MEACDIAASSVDERVPEALGVNEGGGETYSNSAPLVTAGVDSEVAEEKSNGAFVAAGVATTAVSESGASSSIQQVVSTGDAQAPTRSGDKAAGPVAGGQEVVKTPSSIDREKYTGLRITDRCITAEKWADICRGPRRRVVPFSRLVQIEDVGRASQGHDCIMIGVLYDRARSEKFENGERFMAWCLTDLAAHQPRRLTVQLRFQAYMEWSKRKDVNRGSFLALMNPAFVSMGNSSGSALPAVRIEKAAQMLKLGECPALGLCEMKGCKEPVNVDERQRFCVVHLSRVYAEKVGRIASGGGASIRGLLGVEGKANRPAPKQMKPPDPELEATSSERSREDKIAEDNKVALQLDERRQWSSDANSSYVLSMKRGQSHQESSWSRVPVLGRGLQGDGELEIDLDTIDTSEKKKAERLFNQRVERAEAAYAGRAEKQGASRTVPAMGAASTCSVEALASVVAPQKQSVKRKTDGEHAGNKEASPARKTPRVQSASRSLADLLQNKRIPRRADSLKGSSSRAAPSNSTLLNQLHAQIQRPPQTEGEAARESDANAATPSVGAAPAETFTTVGSSAPSDAPPLMTPDAAAAQVDPSAQAMVATAQGLVNDLAAAGENRDRIRAVLVAGHALPPQIWQLEVGQRLYHAVGAMVKYLPEDVKQEAVSARRRWRVASSSQEGKVSSCEVHDSVAGIAGIPQEHPNAEKVPGDVVTQASDGGA